MKKIASLLLSAALFVGAGLPAAQALPAAGAGQAAAPPEEGLVLHYDFSGIENDVVPDLSGNYDGRLMGEAYIGEGYAGDAVVLPGGKEDYVSVPPEALAGCDNITIAAWVRLEANYNWSCLFVAGAETANCISFATQGVPDGPCGVTYGIASGGVTQRVKAPADKAIRLCEWTQIVYTQDDSTGTLYVNGEAVGSGPMTHKPFAAAAGSARIGSSHLYNDPSLVGKVQDFKIYNRALTAEEIRYEGEMEYGELERLLEESAGLSQADYMEDTWAIFTEAQTEAAALVEDAAPTDIARAYGKLRRAVDGLEPVRIRISCVGDSITYGSLCTDGNQMTQSYPAQLQQLLGDGYTVSNFGVNGATMMKEGSLPYVNQQAYQDSLASNPDIVIIMLGTNDANGSNPSKLGAYKQDALDIVRTYQNLPSQPDVYVATSATCYFSDAQPGIIENQVVPMQKEVAEETGCVLIDIHTATKNIGYLFPDNLHPNRQGYCLMAGVMCAAILRQETPTAAITELSAAYAAAREIDRAGGWRYTGASWADFQENMAAAKTLFGQLDTQRDTVVTRVAAGLRESMDGLVENTYPEGLVLQYNFNHVENGVVEDAAGRFDGRIVGNVTASDGFADGAVTFGGGREDYISLPGEVFGMTDDITVSMWVKLDQNPDWTALLIGGGSTPNCFCLAASGTGNGLTYGVNASGYASVRISTDPADKVPAGEWAHIVFTQAGQEGRLYLNGRQIGAFADIPYNPKDLVYGQTVRIGSSHLYNDPSMKGQLEDLSIYNGAMTAAEVADLYAAWQDEDNTVVSLQVPAAMAVASGTDFSDLDLPASIPAETADGRTVDCPVYWEAEAYDGRTPGEYAVTGRLTLPDGLRNPDGLACAVIVTVEEPPVETVDTAALEAAIEAAKETLAGQYLPSSLEGLPAALEAAEALLPNAEASQEDVDAAAGALYAEIEKAAPYLPGDMDGDGIVLINDVMTACRLLARMNAGEEPTADETAVGNLDGDTIISIGDIMMICRLLAQQA